MGAWCVTMWTLWLLAGLATGTLLPLEVGRLHASVGGYAVMNCHLDFPFGNEIPYHLQWDKDDELILSWYSGSEDGGGGTLRVGDRWGGRVVRVDDGRLGLGRGSLNVSAVRETDAGLYRCRVAFPNRSPPERHNGTFYHLDVDGGNLIVTPPMNATVLEGSRAELECRPRNPESTVQWYRDDTPLETLPELRARADLPENGSLVLRNALSSDVGEFQCRVRDPDGTTQSASAFLDVQYKAKVVYAPTERHLALGKPASLDCHFSANPPLTNLRWEKDGFLFDPYNVPGVFYSRNGSLLFNQVDESHEGSYSCTPYNALGSAGASPRVRVFVQRPPRLSSRPQPLYVARRGDTVTMPCTVAPDPNALPPTIVWTRRDGSPLPAGRHSVEDGNLTLAAIAEEDGGVWVCTASNEAAAAAAEAELRVANATPRAPHSLRATPATDSVHLAWEPGHNGVEVEYQVWYRERLVGEWRTMKILSRGVTEATLLGLRPRARYELRVLAQDRLGDGLFSKPLFVTTLGADPEETSEPVSTGTEAFSTEPTAVAAEAGVYGAAGMESPPGGDELHVSVRLLDDGALVQWRAGEVSVSERCSMRWYAGAPPGERLLATGHTDHGYILVRDLEEGVRYWARVQCVGGAAGGAELWVPQWSRMRAAAGGCVGAALLLAAAAAALLLARRRARASAPAAVSSRDKRAR